MGESHTFLAKTIHWLFILLYAYGIFKQIENLEQLEDTGLLIFEVIFACIFLVIVIMRYVYMRRFETFQGATVPVSKMHKYFAKTVHRLMYLCLILLPITGLMIAGLYSQGYTNEDQIMLNSVLEIHGLSADLSYLLIVVHIGAAFWSRIKGEGVWSSMVPIWKEKGPSNNQYVAKISKFEEKFYHKIDEFVSSRK